MDHVWNTEATARTPKSGKGDGVPSLLFSSFRALRGPNALRLLLLGLALLAVACAGPGAAPPTPSPTRLPTAPPPAPSPTPTPPPAVLATPVRTAAPLATPPLSPVSGPLVPPEQTAAVEAAKRDLAQRISVPVADIRLVSATETEWPNTALGCPKPGMFYAQVIVPGYRIILSAKGQQYEYHSDMRGTVVYCETP